MKTPKTPEALRILMELRRSSAASYMPSKKWYKRKPKNKMSDPTATLSSNE